MAQLLTEEHEEVHYILNESDFVQDTSDKTNELSDVILSDGSHAILVNGQILKSEPQTILLQDGDDISQYFIKSDDDSVNTQESQTSDETEIIHYIDEDGNLVTQPTNILYVNEDGVPITQEDLSHYELAQSESGKTQYSHPQIVDSNLLLQGSEELLGNLVDQNEYQYAIMKDGKLHIQTYTDELGKIIEEETSYKPVIDVSSIRGKNLLTGQTVTLQSYIERLHKKIEASPPDSLSAEKSNTRRRKLRNNLKGLLNKKLNLGITSSGKRLVGKVVHVESKEVPIKTKNEKTYQSQYKMQTSSVSDNSGASSEISPQYWNKGDTTSSDIAEDQSKPFTESVNEVAPVNNDHDLYSRNMESIEDLSHSQFNVIFQDSDCFPQITEILIGLMGTDNLKSKLQDKTLLINFVEKDNQLDTADNENISYCSGHMEVEFGYDEHGNFIENWSFVPHSDTEELLRSRLCQDKKINSSMCKYEDVTSLTIINSLQKNNKRLIRVIIHPEHQCSQCDQEFHSNRKLKDHMENIHFECTYCGESFDSLQVVREHKQQHHNKGKLFTCSVSNCGKNFTSKGLLSKHINNHNVDQDAETHSFSDIHDLNTHKNTHHSSKLYACEICKHAFSRYSNLQRHAEIHKGSAQMYSCDICGCSYHYMSSLTRHIVNNHIKTFNIK